MRASRSAARGVVLAEDKRTERFFRKLLARLGFDTRRLTFETAPSGKGSAEAWVRLRYPREVEVLRAKNYQKDLVPVAVRDGDQIGVEGRKRELGEQLDEAGADPRRSTERIATPVPTWSIETWLLALLDGADQDETRSLKREFESAYAREERNAVETAVSSWPSAQVSEAHPPSLLDCQRELGYLDQG